MTRVGILVECGPEGLEIKVCEKICELLNSEDNANIRPTIVPMDNKRRLIEECGTATANLLRDGCQRVVILWDERPAWPKTGERLCWHNDRQHILAELEKANVADRPVYLVCIEREFESWLLFDHGMLSEVLSRDTHKVKLKKQRRPDQEKDPKAKMRKLFKQQAGLTYVDTTHARKFADNLTSLNKLRGCKTFLRFAAKVTGS